MNDRKHSLNAFAVLTLMVPVGFGLALIDFRTDDRLQVAQAPTSPRSAPASALPVPAQQPIRPRPPAPLPVEGDIEDVTLANGDVMHMQKLPDDYIHEADNAGDQGDAFQMEAPPELPPNRMPVNPQSLGFASMWELEQHVRNRYGIEGDKPIEIWMEQRGTKLGVAVDVINPEPEPTN